MAHRVSSGDQWPAEDGDRVMAAQLRLLAGHRRFATRWASTRSRRRRAPWRAASGCPGSCWTFPLCPRLMALRCTSGALLLPAAPTQARARNSRLLCVMLPLASAACANAAIQVVMVE